MIRFFCCYVLSSISTYLKGAGLFYTRSVSQDDCKSSDLIFLHWWKLTFIFFSEQTSLSQLDPRATVRSEETPPALPSQKVTPKEGDSLESGSLRNKCKLAALAKERHITRRPWTFQVGSDSASGQERSSPDVTKARGQPKAAELSPGPSLMPSLPLHCVSSAALGANFLPTR